MTLGVASKAVVVFDPDWLNPYGREVAGTLKDAGYEVVIFQAVTNEWSVPGLETARVLAPAADMLPMLATLSLRLRGCVRASGTARRRRAPLVLADTRGAYENCVFLMSILCGIHLVIIDHNPIASRIRRGFVGLTDRLLRRFASMVVVHSESLAESAAKLATRRIAVVPHVPYRQWASRFGTHVPPTPEDGNYNLLFLGALRPDKGWDEVPTVLAATTKRPLTLLLAGRNAAAGNQTALIEASGVSVVRVNKGPFATDSEVAEAMQLADLLLAPYVDVTQSGTVTLALTIGLPVLGYDSGGLKELLSPRARVAVGNHAELGARVDAFRASPFETFSMTPDELCEKATAAWRAVLERLDA